MVLVVVKMVLGSSHLESREYGRDNLHVSSHFLASLLDNAELKAVAKILLVKLFGAKSVENVGEVLCVVVEGKGFLRPCDVD
jgi:hypothetical protein